MPLHSPLHKSDLAGMVCLKGVQEDLQARRVERVLISHTEGGLGATVQRLIKESTTHEYDSTPQLPRKLHRSSLETMACTACRTASPLCDACVVTRNQITATSTVDRPRPLSSAAMGIAPQGTVLPVARLLTAIACVYTSHSQNSLDSGTDLVHVLTRNRP